MAAMVLFMAAGVTDAAVVNLKNGKVMEGKVLERTADTLKLEVESIELTYYADEIASVDGAAFAATPGAAESKAAAPAMADGSADMNKDALIRKFVEIYGVKQNMKANFDQMTGMLTPDQVATFHKMVSVDEIVELLLPLYDKYFTEDDLRAYIQFYDSAQGRKLTQTLPLLMKDSVDISMKYLNERLPESMK